MFNRKRIQKLEDKVNELVKIINFQSDEIRKLNMANEKPMYMGGQ